MSVVEAVRRELRELGAEESALGAGALVLAARLEDDETASTAVPAYHRELRETLAELRSAASAGDEDRMTEFERRREEREQRRASA